MVINMSELFTAEGDSKEYVFMPGVSELEWRGESYPITAENPVSFRLTHLGERRVDVKGSACIHVQIPCDRCLEPVDIPINIDIDREVDANATPQERIAQLDEQSFVDGCLLDADRLLLDEIILNMPGRVLCAEDCKGLCPKCGINLNHDSCDCDTRELDPRMAAILDVFKGSEA